MLIRWIDVGGCERSDDLAGVLAALSREEVASFPALRPHQRMPLHAFCVQLGAIALHRSGVSEAPREAATWRTLLTALTPDHPDGEAWTLVSEDWRTPAILQPPVSDASAIAQHKPAARTPDELDMLVTARNHDLKAARIGAVDGVDDDHWFFALMTLQTCAGLLGRGNYGISRMNSGYGSRVFMGIRPPGGPGTAFLRNLREALAARPELVAHDPDLRDDGDALLWLTPWDGRSRPFAGLDPFYIEICRRVRLVRTGDGIVAHIAGSAAPRLEAKARNGVTGDLWAPVERSDPAKSWGIGEEGFGYRKVLTLLDAEKVIAPPLARVTPRDAERGLRLRFVAVRGGQGKTEGFHERSIPVPVVRLDRRRFGPGSRRELDEMAKVAKRRADMAGRAGFALRRALEVLHQRGFEEVKRDDTSIAAKVAPWMSAFDREVDAVFFDHVFEAEVAGEPGEYRRVWANALVGMARRVFDRAAAAAPRTQVKRIRAQARARSVLDRRLASFREENVDAFTA